MEYVEDFSILFRSLDEAKEQQDYSHLDEALKNIDKMRQPIEELQEIVMASEAQRYSVLITI